MPSEAKSKINMPSHHPTKDVDHRKRRRNRTTQSCLNCHTSKRMCDRKRPACARCTQLGLTGLCVYEVDDPNQRTDSQNESARLLKRVAELEGVIRELKHKPHPRWSIASDRWAPSNHQHNSALGLQGSSVIDAVSSNQLTEESLLNRCPSVCTFTTQSISENSLTLKLLGRKLSVPTDQSLSSPRRTPSPSLTTPSEEYSHPTLSVAIEPNMVSACQGFPSTFFAYPDLSTPENLASGHVDDASSFTKPHGVQCGCLREATNYNVVLELSIRLRKAADVLARSSSHPIGSTCLLNRHISDLDIFTRSYSNSLANMVTLPDNYILNQETNFSSPAFPVYSFHARKSSFKFTSSQLQPWDMMPKMSSSPLTSDDDSLMSWEPPQRMI